MTKYDPDPLGLDADIQHIPMPLWVWKNVATMKLPFKEIVRMYGQPPKTAMKYFKKKKNAKK